MNDILQQIMNMIENTRTVPSISSFSMIGFTVLLIFGVINCILGYRLLRFWMMLCGFVIGAGIGFGAAYTGGVTEKEYQRSSWMKNINTKSNSNACSQKEQTERN